MGFDWFQRNAPEPSDEDKKPSNASTESQSTESQTPDSAASSSPTGEGAGEEFDYLAFAKAAYANLKAKEATASSPTADAATVSSDAAASPAADDGSHAPPPPPATPSTSLEPPVLEEVAETVPAASTPSPAAEVSPSLSQPDQPEPDLPESASSSSQPAAFFEMAPKATERLEALEATAIEEPVPEVESGPAQTPTSGVEAFPEFDEGFMWSAEVLAAQGRRVDQVTYEEITWLQKLRRGLGKTRLSLVNQLKSLVGKGPINDEAVEEIETLLLQADVGIAATDTIVEALQARMRQDVLPPEEAVMYLKELLRDVLSVGEPTFAPEKETLNIWLMVGVNGAGKTTTLGKIAHLAQKSGYRCLVAAGDTFRAAAVEQLQVWGERAQVEVIANPGQNTDPAAVVFDAIAAAQARDADLLLVDTAGRLQNKKNLMDELTKIRRIVDKKAPNAVVESLLVLDATLGQNGLRQAQVFSEAANLSGVVLTKLDGTAKGGVALAVAKEMELPIRFIGVGEGLEDLRPFSSYEFVEALVSEY